MLFLWTFCCPTAGTMVAEAAFWGKQCTNNSRYGSPLSFFLCKSSYLVLGPYLLCSFYGRFVVRQPGPWRRKRHFGASYFPFQANEGVLQCPRPPASILFSSDGSTGHLDRLKCHFWRSFDRRRQPQSCAGNEQYKVILI